MIAVYSFLKSKWLLHNRIEALIGACFFYSGLLKLARWWTRQCGQSLVILNYHQASGGDLRSHLLYLRRHYHILHLEEALEELYTSHKDRQQNNRRTPLVLTFDDGYFDNFTHATTLADELQVPITIFLIPAYIENGHRFWWREADYLVSHSPLSKVTIDGQAYRLDRPTERQALIHEIDSHMRYAKSVIEREQFIVEMCKTLFVSSSVTIKEKAALPLTWSQVRDMEKTGWVSFGAHTMNHAILGYLDDPKEVDYEVSESRFTIERNLGHSVHTFAYPVGLMEHIGKHGIQAVRKAGYHGAVTTINGFNTSKTEPYLLRRIVVDVDQHWMEVAAKASGIWEVFFHPFRLLITLLTQQRKHNWHKQEEKGELCKSHN